MVSKRWQLLSTGDEDIFRLVTHSGIRLMAKPGHANALWNFNWISIATGVIAIRSASRVGYSDLGVNRRRVQALREMSIRPCFDFQIFPAAAVSSPHAASSSRPWAITPAPVRVKWTGSSCFMLAETGYRTRLRT
ncbi:MAG: DUF1499 domain-containing protein [Pseudomonadota bacterium]